MKTYSHDYLITAHGILERGLFYNYMHELGYKDHFMCTREEMINSPYPFAVCIELKELSIIESATICYLNAQMGRVKSIEDFKSIIENKKV